MFELGQLINHLSCNRELTVNRTCFPLAFLVVLMAGEYALADGKPDSESKARDFSYKSAKFGMTLADFERDFSVGMPIEANQAARTATYEIVVSQGKVMRMEFLRERLTKMWVFITAQEVARVGGKDAVEKKMIELFGRPQIIKDGAYAWQFPNVKRNVAYAYQDEVSAELWWKTLRNRARTQEDNHPT